MARGDGIHRTNARNMRLTAAKIGNAQQHNEREKESYVNQDIVPERTHLNVHFKEPTAGYAEMFEQWSTFPSWKSKSYGRNAARINRWWVRSRKRYSRSA